MSLRPGAGKKIHAYQVMQITFVDCKVTEIQ